MNTSPHPAAAPRFRHATKAVTTILITAGLVIGGSLPATAAPAAPATTSTVQSTGVIQAAAPKYPATGGTKRFVDVKKSHASYKAITWMYQTGLSAGMAGKGGRVFKPTSSLSREALAAILYRQAGNPSFKMPSQRFVDVKKSNKYYKQIMWLKAKGYMHGSSTKKGRVFKPTSRVTREAMAVTMYRIAGKPRYKQPPTRFVDVKKSNSYYQPIMWARSAGLIGGYTTKKGYAYAPKSSLTRQALATMLYRKAGRPAFVDSGTVKITGTVKVGQTVTAAAAGWTPTSIQYQYQWYLNGKAIPGATAATYPLTVAEEGGHLQVRVSGLLTNAATVRMTTASTQVQGLKVTPGTATITGKAEVEQTLTATTTGWAPQTAALSYEWLRGGVPIPGANAATLPLTVADQGKAISVRVTGTLEAHAPAVVTSKAVTVVPKRITNAEATEIVRQTIFAEVNNERVKYGLNALEWAPQYAAGADADSLRQLNSYLNTGVGAGHVPQVSYWEGYGITDPAEAPFDVIGAAGGSTPEQVGKDVVKSWMSSPAHCWWVLRESASHMYPGVATMDASDFNPGTDGGFSASMMAIRHDPSWDTIPGYSDQDPSWPANQVCR